MSFKNRIVSAWDKFNRICEYLQPLANLLARIWIARAFFFSGLIKIRTWDTTTMLFTFEYHIPFLPPQSAAIIAAAIELIVSPLILLGLGGRLPALILLLFNFAAISAYPFLWTQAGYMVLKDHICWGLLLLFILLYGPGKLSVDYLIQKRKGRVD